MPLNYYPNQPTEVANPPYNYPVDNYGERYEKEREE
jgi:hypothetical protein